MNSERMHELPLEGRGAPRLQRRQGSDYQITEDERAFFQEHGYLVLRGVLSPEELAQIEAVFERFRRGEIPNMGKDFCDMSGSLAKRPEEFTLVNAMLPRHYYPAFQGNLYEQRSQSIARQLLGDDMQLDYDQFLTKKPERTGAVFAWHQDMAYWPKKTPDTRTVTCSLALDDADLENGCLRVVPGSHRARLRPHRPLAADLAIRGEARDGSRDEAHALVMDLATDDEIVYLPVQRGDITLHNEWIVHGSAGNRSQRFRRTYVIAYRSAATIARERALGFTHSHNDHANWDTFEQAEGVN